MRAILQRVSRASVEVDGRITGEIGPGFLVLLGVGKGDSEKDADYLSDKIINLRVFPDGAGKMNCSVLESGGALLVVSQFTLYGDVRKGRRPSFDAAAPPEEAQRLYEYFVEAARRSEIRVETGVFQAMMKVDGERRAGDDHLRLKPLLTAQARRVDRTANASRDLDSWSAQVRARGQQTSLTGPTRFPRASPPEAWPPVPV